MKDPVGTLTPPDVAIDGRGLGLGGPTGPGTSGRGSADRGTTRPDGGSGRSPLTERDTEPTTPGSFAWAAERGTATPRIGREARPAPDALPVAPPGRRAGPTCAPSGRSSTVGGASVRCSGSASAGVRPGGARAEDRPGLWSACGPPGGDRRHRPHPGPRPEARHGSAVLSGARQERRSWGRTTRPRIAPRKLVEIQIFWCWSGPVSRAEGSSEGRSPRGGDAKRKRGGGTEEGSARAAGLPPGPGRSGACAGPRIVGRARARLTGRAGRPRGAGARCPRTH